MEKLFYVLHNNTPSRISAAKQTAVSLDKHFQSIDILVPQAYQIDENGMLWGAVDSDILQFARAHKMKLMPLITNTKFNKQIVHQFLLNQNAKTRAINAILEACQKQHYGGVQFDFEMVSVEDKDLLTQFYLAAAAALHKNNLSVSFAVAPLVTDNPQASDFLKKIYANWEGAYDLKKIGEASDFVSIMAYNQHGGITTPGPTASIVWVEAAIQYALQYIPPQKISLGIPDYSNYWFTSADPNDASGKIKVHSIGISYEKAMYLNQKYKAHLQWDDTAKISMAIYERDWLNEYLFVENTKSFAAKLALVKKYHLRGISVFDLGTEDPLIWNVFKST